MSKIIGLLLIFCLGSLTKCDEADCTIEGFTEKEWGFPLIINISDLETGLIFQRDTTSIRAINSVKTVLYPLNKSPYVNVTLRNGIFRLEMMAKFDNYEAEETSQSMAYEVSFQCDDGNNKSLTIKHNIKDTNNHAPEFLISNTSTFTIPTPLPKGFPITFFTWDIIVRDVDLTNYQIVPQIQPNDYFDLVYIDGIKKDHKLALVTKKEIIDFESITLLVSVSDKDRTGYPARTTFGQFKITKDPLSGSNPGKIEFDRPFYLGVFDNDEASVKLNQPISLKTGFDKEIVFTLEGNGSEYFTLDWTANNIDVLNSSVDIPEGIIMKGDPIVLTILANKPNTMTTAIAVLNIRLVSEPNCALLGQNADVWETGLFVNIFDEGFSTTTIGTMNIISVLDYYHEPGEVINPPYVYARLGPTNLLSYYSLREYDTYEEIETAISFKLFSKFKCKRGVRTLKATFRIKDTNNHYPVLLPLNYRTYNVKTPIPAGYSISRTYGELIFTDYDLTNYALNATWSKSEYFALVYRGPGPTPKEYVYDFVTLKAIDMIDNKLLFTGKITDIDLTGQAKKSTEFDIVVQNERKDILS